jgi:uncharacterized membrane protein
VIWSILQIVAGLILSLFMPGYLLARIFFKELTELEKVALGFVLSICLDIALGLFLGYNETMKNLTGGITAFNLWLYLIIITVILMIVYVFTNKKEVIAMLDILSGEQHPRHHAIQKAYQEEKLKPQKNIVHIEGNRKIIITKYSDFQKRNQDIKRMQKPKQ